MYDPAVLQGILDERIATENGSPLWVNLYKTIWASRQGSGTAATILDANGHLAGGGGNLFNAAAAAGLPTIFAKPFRSSTANALVPIDKMRNVHSTSSEEREIGSTFLRPDPTTTTKPMLESPGVMNFKEYANQNAPFANTSTSPYFAYEEIRRLDNLVTNKSNVYAMWITVGYFEVTAAVPNPADPDFAVKYPDGWTLGAEMGSDTGDIQRHRAFYMYDRSIPVGFERGENHNVDRGILVERYIE